MRPASFPRQPTRRPARTEQSREGGRARHGLQRPTPTRRHTPAVRASAELRPARPTTASQSRQLPQGPYDRAPGRTHLCNGSDISAWTLTLSLAVPRHGRLIGPSKPLLRIRRVQHSRGGATPLSTVSTEPTAKVASPGSVSV